MNSFGSLKRSEKKTIDRALDMESGYVLDFSNRTIEEHFEDEFGIEFYSSRYSRNGGSKAKVLRTILEDHSGPAAAQILRNLWELRSTLPIYGERNDPRAEETLRDGFFSIVLRLEGDTPAIDMGAFNKFDDTDSLHALVQSIERDIREDAPEAAMDRLHLFCVKRFRHLLEIRQIDTKLDEPLNSLVGKYKNALEAEGQISEMSLIFIRYSIAVFEKFNDIRNNRSLAHDNQLLDPNEARFIFDAVSAVLRFIKRVDSSFDN